MEEIVQTTDKATANKKNNTRKIVDAFTSSVDSTKEYSLDDLKKLLTEAFKSTKKSKKGEGEEKRQPSKYNIFVKEQMLKIKQENPTKDNKEIMSIAASLWKEHKLANP